MIPCNYTPKHINRLKSKENAIKSKGITYNSMQRKNCITTRKHHKKDKCNNTIKGKTLVLSSYLLLHI